MKKFGAEESKYIICNKKEIKKQDTNKFLKKAKKKRKSKNNYKYIKINSTKFIFKSKRLLIKRPVYLYIILFIVFLSLLSFLFFMFYKNLFHKNISEIEDNKILFNKNMEKEEKEKDFNQQLNDIQNYMDLVFNGIILDKDKIYYPSKNPKISVVISVYNGEGYLKTAILSIQNQDLKDIEIILVDDDSKDNSVNLIKEIMKTEPRIVLYQNKENKGALYTKSKGILLSKGKYVLVLDEDDMFVQRDAFSSLYAEAEKNNLDVLVFSGKHSGSRIPRFKPNYGNNKKIITQPELSNIMYVIDSKGNVKQNAGILVTNFMRTKIIQKAIKKIDEKNMNTKMTVHDDFIIVFLLTRTANRMKSINRHFYIWLKIWNERDPKISLRNQIKLFDLNNKDCFSYLNFLEILFKNTKNTVEDKKIAFSQLETWYLNNHCRSNKDTREKALEVFKLYLGCELISDKDKKKIQKFIDG